MKKNFQGLKEVEVKNVLEAEQVEFSFLPGNESFPLLITPVSKGQDLNRWVKDNQSVLSDKVSQYGALLFRGFGIDTVEKFGSFTDCFDAPAIEYTQRTSPRSEVSERIYHSTSYPSHQHINMHSESSYATIWASKIVFCCIVPPGKDGETPVADNRLVLQYLSPATKEKFLAKGVKYVRNISAWVGLSWEEVFQTTDKAVVEAECARSGMSYTWEEDRLVLTWNNRAIYQHPVTQEAIWFNHAFFFNKYAYDEEVLMALGEDELPFNTYYGDGSEISKAEIEEIKEAYQKATVKFPWEKGDVLFLDNMLMSHGRSAYQGDRKIIVSMF